MAQETIFPYNAITKEGECKFKASSGNVSDQNPIDALKNIAQRRRYYLVAVTDIKGTHTRYVTLEAARNLHFPIKNDEILNQGSYQGKPVTAIIITDNSLPLEVLTEEGWQGLNKEGDTQNAKK